MSNIRTSQIMKLPFTKRWLLGAGIMLTLLVASWVVQAQALPLTPYPIPPLQVEGYPINNLPASVKLMKYVATFNMGGQGMDLLPTSAGFLTKKGDDFLMHDWRDGHCRWQVSVIQHNEWGPPWSEINNSSFALSDDGRYFTASTVEKHGVRVRRWRDGKIDGDCTILASQRKPPKPGYYELAIANNGRILLDYYYDERKTAPKYLLALDGHRVIASAKIPMQTHILPGGVMACDYTRKILYSIQVNTGHIRFSPIAHKFTENFVQCPGNYLLAFNGAVYTPAGRKLPPTPQHKINYYDQIVRSNRSNLIPWHTDQVVFSRAGNRHEVFCLSSQTHWTFTTKPGMDDGVASADGRFVLLHGKGDIKDGPNDNPGILAQGTDAVWLYERPGTLRAALRFATGRDVHFMGEDDPRLVGESCGNWILSPDGHSVILKYQYLGLDGIALLYRW